MNCPHCGAAWKGWRAMFDCDSYPSGKEGCVKRTESCYDRQIAQLKAELDRSNQLAYQWAIAAQRCGLYRADVPHSTPQEWQSAQSSAACEMMDRIASLNAELAQSVRRDDVRLTQILSAITSINNQIHLANALRSRLDNTALVAAEELLRGMVERKEQL